LHRFSDHGDHPITRDHPIVDATKIPAGESQIVQSGHSVAGADFCLLTSWDIKGEALGCFELLLLKLRYHG
jgi:hypothetical protein